MSISQELSNNLIGYRAAPQAATVFVIGSQGIKEPANKTGVVVWLQ